MQSIRKKNAVLWSSLGSFFDYDGLKCVFCGLGLTLPVFFFSLQSAAPACAEQR